MNNQKTKEIEGFFKEIKASIRLRLLTTVVFFIFAVVLYWVESIRISAVIAILLFFWILEQLIVFSIAKRRATISSTDNLHFGQFIFDLLMLGIVTYFIETVCWIAPLFYVFTIIYSGFFISKISRRIFLICFALLLYVGLTFLEYFGIISHTRIFFPADRFQDLTYILTTVSLVGGTFVLIALTVGIFAGRLKQNTVELAVAYQELEKSKSALEVKVESRTKELRELTGKLEEKVKQRTEELQEKMVELGKFNKLAIGRELKMTQLKEEIEMLKKE